MIESTEITTRWQSLQLQQRSTSPNAAALDIETWGKKGEEKKKATDLCKITGRQASPDEIPLPLLPNLK